MIVNNERVLVMDWIGEGATNGCVGSRRMEAVATKKSKEPWAPQKYSSKLDLRTTEKKLGAGSLRRSKARIVGQKSVNRRCSERYL